MNLITVASETVLVDEISYPSKITTTKSLSLLGHGKLLHTCVLLLKFFQILSIYDLYLLISVSVN